jgi:thiamine transporter ThiT
MKKGITYRIVLSAMLIAVGLILPYITAHAFGMQGTILLPMHLPVFLIGFLCGPQFGAIGGIIIPVLSSLLTGMPPVYPVLPFMAGELFTYGLVSGLLYKKAKLPLYPSLLISMVCGRIESA